MTPLETNRNRDVGNSDYTTKRRVFQESNFLLTRAVAEHYDTWDEAKIESRQKKLAQMAAGIWKIEFGG